MTRLPAGSSRVPAVVAALLTAALLTVVYLKAPNAPILLARFVPFGGAVQILVVSLYAGWLCRKVLEPRHARRLRPRVWLAFSILFYAQLLLGLLGVERILMTGHLHLPIPMVIAAGPAFRGGGWFMAILFGISLIFVGPAWCSWLCYLGGWDNLAALRRKKPRSLPSYRRWIRLGLLVGSVGVALWLGRLGVSGAVAAALGGSFGLVGVGIIAFVSPRYGVMVHCVSYCPMGWLATRLGKISPFRIQIDSTCSECMACTFFCRYDALGPSQILARRVGEACTLCGDCVTSCARSHDIHYSFLGLRPTTARTFFLVLAVSMHATFVGVAMI